MKMLTGLLPPTEGEALLFGQPLDAGDMRSRYRVGYMSQSFSLYTELTVRQNLDLHARLFHLPARQGEGAHRRAGRTVRPRGSSRPAQRWICRSASASACRWPSPSCTSRRCSSSTSRPRASIRWRGTGSGKLLIDLSRNQGVTIFVSTHFMNEAERCDRISLMDSGRVLATGTPAELVKARGVATLEDAFISYLEEATGARAARRRRRRRAGRRARRRPRDVGSRAARSACGGCSPIRSARRWNCCATRSGSASPVRHGAC